MFLLFERVPSGCFDWNRAGQPVWIAFSKRRKTSRRIFHSRAAVSEEEGICRPV